MDNIYRVDTYDVTPRGGDNLSVLTNESDAPPHMTSPCPGIEAQLDVGPAVFFAVLFVVGFFNCFCGYRWLKVSLFTLGLLSSAALIYAVCTAEELLPVHARIPVALLLGALVGLVTALLLYVGLFLLGFMFGMILGITALVIASLFVWPSSMWVPAGVVFLSGLFFALAILYFQRGLAINGTALIGACLFAMCVDYFIQALADTEFVFNVVLLRRTDLICWYNWAILCVVPGLFVIGAVIQWRVTAKDVDHRQAVFFKRRAGPGRANSATGTGSQTRPGARPSTTSARYSDVMPTSPAGSQRRYDVSTSPPSRSYSRYRHLYQVRRINGDVISQNYLRGIQDKLSTAVRTKVLANQDTPSVSRVEADPDSDQSQTDVPLTRVPDETQETVN